jgi:hypothetical protein
MKSSEQGNTESPYFVNIDPDASLADVGRPVPQALLAPLYRCPPAVSQGRCYTLDEAKAALLTAVLRKLVTANVNRLAPTPSASLTQAVARPNPRTRQAARPAPRVPF